MSETDVFGNMIHDIFSFIYKVKENLNNQSIPSNLNTCLISTQIELGPEYDESIELG